MDTNKHEWIAPATSLPPDGESVLVHNKFWGDDRFHQVRRGFLDTGHWFFDNDTCEPCLPPPTHWTRWPEPPLAAEISGQKSAVRPSAPHLDVMGTEGGKAATETH